MPYILPEKVQYVRTHNPCLLTLPQMCAILYVDFEHEQLVVNYNPGQKCLGKGEKMDWFLVFPYKSISYLTGIHLPI